jgi:hypothetical protein
MRNDGYRLGKLAQPYLPLLTPLTDVLTKGYRRRGLQGYTLLTVFEDPTGT